MKIVPAPPLQQVQVVMKNPLAHALMKRAVVAVLCARWWTQRGRYARCRGGRGRLSGIGGARCHVRTYKSSKSSNATSMSSFFPDKCVSITLKGESFLWPISIEFCALSAIFLKIMK